MKPRPTPFMHLFERFHRRAALIGTIVPEGQPNAGWLVGPTMTGTDQHLMVGDCDQGPMMWSDAVRCAAANNARLPTSEELQQLQLERNTRCLRGFNECAVGYWSSESRKAYDTRLFVKVVRFNDGLSSEYPDNIRALVRLVRG